MLARLTLLWWRLTGEGQAESAINDVKSIREKLSSVTAELEELTKVHAREVHQHVICKIC